MKRKVKDIVFPCTFFCEKYRALYVFGLAGHLQIFKALRNGGSFHKLFFILKVPFIFKPQGVFKKKFYKFSGPAIFGKSLIEIVQDTLQTSQTALMGGMPIIWRDCFLVAITSDKDKPQLLHQPGFSSIILSGTAVISKVFSSLPFCPPTLLPKVLRKLWFALGQFSSLEGSMELLRLLLGFSYLARRSLKKEFSYSRASAFSPKLLGV